MKKLKRLAELLLSAAFIVLMVAAMLYLIDEIMDGHSILLPLVALWGLLAYIILPRIHRFLTKIYLPNYFIGRTRHSDGFYSDPVNIAFNGSEADLHRAMRAAGWTRADDLNLKSAWKISVATIRKHSYKNAPVSSLYLFSEKQDFAYQQEVKGNPRIRHHVRFWKTPPNWWLPGGSTADWLAAASFDKHVGFSLYTGQITHKVAADTDEERNYVVDTLLLTPCVENVKVKKHFTTAFRHRNGGGDQIKTDGSLPFVTLKSNK